jgi:hypothetical protein
MSDYLEKGEQCFQAKLKNVLKFSLPTASFRAYLFICFVLHLLIQEKSGQYPEQLR